MEESKLEWLHALDSEKSDRPESVKSNWKQLPVAPAKEVKPIWFIDRGNETVGKADNLVDARRLRKILGGVIRLYEGLNNDDIQAIKEEKRQSHMSGSRPFFKEPGDGQALFSKSMKSSCRPERYATSRNQPIINRRKK